MKETDLSPNEAEWLNPITRFIVIPLHNTTDLIY